MNIGRHNIGAYLVPYLLPRIGSHVTQAGITCYYVVALGVQIIYCKKPVTGGR